MKAALLLALTLAGCISSAPTVPVTPANSTQISDCQSMATSHNAFTIGGFALGFTGSTLAGVSAGLAQSDPNASKDMAITATAVSASAAAAAVLAAYYGSAVANSNCSDVTGPLPVLPLDNERDAGVDAAFPQPGESVTIVTSPDHAHSGGFGYN